MVHLYLLTRAYTRFPTHTYEVVRNDPPKLKSTQRSTRFEKFNLNTHHIRADMARKSRLVHAANVFGG